MEGGLDFAWPNNVATSFREEIRTQGSRAVIARVAAGLGQTMVLTLVSAIHKQTTILFFAFLY